MMPLLPPLLQHAAHTPRHAAHVTAVNMPMLREVSMLLPRRHSFVLMLFDTPASCCRHAAMICRAAASAITLMIRRHADAYADISMPLSPYEAPLLSRCCLRHFLSPMLMTPPALRCFLSFDSFRARYDCIAHVTQLLTTLFSMLRYAAMLIRACFIAIRCY